MGFDMRGNNGRYPPFLLGGCVLLCIVLICNWWSISSQNHDLIKQIDILEEQIKICFGERSKLETNVGQLNIRNNEQKQEKDTIIKRRDNELTRCTTELESLKNLDASKTESLNTLRATLDKKKEEVKMLTEKITILNAIKTAADMKEYQNQKQASKDEKSLDNGNDVQNKEGIDDIVLENKETTEEPVKEREDNRDVKMSNE